jgi:hypothetical protein
MIESPPSRGLTVVIGKSKGPHTKLNRNVGTVPKKIDLNGPQRLQFLENRAESRVVRACSLFSGSRTAGFRPDIEDSPAIRLH